MYDNIAKIIKSNKKIEELIEIEKKIVELKENLEKIDKKDSVYDNLMCEISVREMKLEYAKKRLDKESLKIYENLEMFSEFNKLTEKIKKMEKKSKKSHNLVVTENSEGRKKEIDSDFVDYYNLCVENKKKLSKNFSKAISFFSNYEPKKEIVIEKVKEEIKPEVKKVGEKTNYVGIACISYTNPALEKKDIIEEIPQENKKKVIPFINKIKKYAVGAVVGLAALASVISFGGSKENKNTTNNVRIETEADANEKIKEFENNVSMEKQIDTILAVENKKNVINELPIIETDVEITEELINPTLGDNLKVSDTAKIMCDQYEATNYENGKHPYYNSNEERTIEGVVYRLPDGKIKTARSEDEVCNFESIDGAEVTAYLTYSKYGVEGFYSVQDVIVEKTLTRKL